jgi:hypothetical protein
MPHQVGDYSWVHGRERVVKQGHGGACEGNTRQSNTCTLATGKIHTTLPNFSLIPEISKLRNIFCEAASTEYLIIQASVIRLFP